MLHSNNSLQDTNSGQLAFLRRVSSDDQFRSELESNPQAALAQFGLHIDAEQIPQSVTIPQRAAVSALFEDLESSEVSDRQGVPEERWLGFLGQ